MNGPDLKVIDRAINMIKTQHTYSCTALFHAQKHRPRYLFDSLYVRQYTLWVMRQNGGRLPFWWNGYEPYKKYRLAALRGFRAACIDAAKKGKK